MKFVVSLFFVFILVFTLSGCGHSSVAQRIKIVGLKPDMKRGKAVGAVRGEDCTWKVLGVNLGPRPNLTKALLSSEEQIGSLNQVYTIVDGLEPKTGDQLKYVVNVRTEYQGFNALVVGRDCLIVRGVGYQ